MGAQAEEEEENSFEKSPSIRYTFLTREDGA
jgi:hypothetical protein